MAAPDPIPDPVPDPDPIEQKLIDRLDSLGVPYEILPCNPEWADTIPYCEHYGVTMEESANSILVVGKSEPRVYCGCVATADTKVDVNNTVKRLLGVKKASFASPEEIAQITGMLIGGVTAVALPEDIPVYVDSRVLDQPSVIIGGGSRSIKARVSPEVFRKLPNATVVEGLSVRSTQQ
jgi:prolyl-tRNA editing enzyme YbaK/EbsC (Cys-tRNA(Pro) deacylase)